MASTPCLRADRSAATLRSARNQVRNQACKHFSNTSGRCADKNTPMHAEVSRVLHSRKSTFILTCAVFVAMMASTLALAIPSSNQPATSAPRDIAASIRSEVNSLGLKKAVIAVSVRDCATGYSIISYHGNEPMTPASNMKLLTTGAALLGLGPDFVFRTRLLRDGDRLLIVGDGDPALGDPELLAQSSYVDASGVAHNGLTIDDLLATWTNAIKASGMKSVSELVVDDRIFVREGAHPLWPKDQLDEGYCSPPSGMNFHGNGLCVKASPNPGHAPTITSMSPSAPWLTIVNKGTSRTGKNDRNTMWIARQPETGELTIFGNVKIPYVVPITVGIGDPATFLAQCVAYRLIAAGIPVQSTRLAAANDPAPKGIAVGPVLQTPLATVLTHCNVESQNLYAESLMKRLAAKITGAPGSWANGSIVVKGALAANIGADADAFVISDGSGLSRGNRVTADGMTAWITALANNAAIGAIFVDSLAVGGKSGTVRKRMKDIDPAVATVQCKTGYIDKVSCLSGFVTARDGTRYAFSVLANNLCEVDSVGKAKKLQERVAKVIADSLAARPKPALGG